MTTIELAYCDTAYKYSPGALKQAGQNIIKHLVNLFTDEGMNHEISFASQDVDWRPSPLHEEAVADDLFMRIEVRDFSAMPKGVAMKDVAKFKSNVVASLREAFGNGMRGDFVIEFRFTPQDQLRYC